MRACVRARVRACVRTVVQAERLCQVLGVAHPDAMMDDVFLKVDRDCDGRVSWDEYLSYIQLRYTEQDHMYYSAHIIPFPARCTTVGGRTTHTSTSTHHALTYTR